MVRKGEKMALKYYSTETGKRRQSQHEVKSIKLRNLSAVHSFFFLLLICPRFDEYTVIVDKMF